jgi:predicted esterase
MRSILHPPSSIFALLLLLLLSFAAGALAQPVITPTTNFQNIAVFLGSNATFSATAAGTEPLAYQWRRDGMDLLDNTTATLTIPAAQPPDEGDYTLVVTNVAGAVTSAPARLWVVPPPTDMIRSDFTNASGQRLPYFYLMPSNYTSARSYPVICMFHGAGQDENLFTSPAGLRPYKFVFDSYRQQATAPAIILWPTRRAGGTDWTMEYLQLTGELLDALPNRFNIDTNRICVGGASQGVHAAWDMVGLRPSFFAAVFLGSGWRGSASATAIKNVPAWVCSAANDSLVTTTRALVNGLRQAGGNPIYTEYVSSGHVDGITGTL